MRLGTLLLTAALALPAQTPRPLPWMAAPPLPWKTAELTPLPVPPRALPTQTYFALTLHLSKDGALRITDDAGLVRLRTGLPGRPLKVWRDWGIPVADPYAPLGFPGRTPLMRGIGGLPVGAPDFRPALEGLFWVLDDDEKRITLIHPAASRLVYLPLPGESGLDLVFRPDRLEVRELRSLAGGGQDTVCWSIPWLALLPQFIHLGQENPNNRPSGTAMVPYPKESAGF